ncbi:MAG: hypothetical protein V2B15_01100, partial [Bacteroidota bacterium]
MFENRPNWILKLYSAARALFVNYSLPRWLVFLFDASSLFLSFIFAYLLRFNFEPQSFVFNLVLQQSVVVLFVYCTFELLFKSYSGLIRHTTIDDIFRVLLTTTSSMVALILLVVSSRFFGWNEAFNVPVSIVLIHFITVSAVLFFARILIKMFYEVVSIKPGERKNVIIFGAGTMGVIVKRVILSDTANHYNIVAFLDNNRKLQNKNLSGTPVLSP